MTDYVAVLTHDPAYAGAEWALSGDTYAGLTWLSDGPKPTKATLDKKWPKVQHDLEVARIKAARRARYQAETDGLYFAAMREDTPSLTEWIAAVNQIKADLPYPEEP